MKVNTQQVRIGIDVGGTFTDVVVVDHTTREVISQLKVPTTHSATEGVALGIINAINRTLTDLNIRPEAVVFIAHSTTQATNALLEGDVAKVGIIGIGEGIEIIKAKTDTRIPPIELAPNRFLSPDHAFIKAETTILEQHVSAQYRPNQLLAEPFADSVGIGFYRIDLHPSLGGDNYVDVESLPFQIPLGALIPQRMENILPACKNIGTTHITNGCYRLHPIEWNIGESVGFLLAFCLRNSKTLRQVRNDADLLRGY